jgi:hypothetical protein
MEFAIILFQLIKDKYIKDGHLHLKLKRSMSPKIMSYEYNHTEREQLKITLDENIIIGEVEINYHSSYNDPCRRDIYYKTFLKIKKNVWKTLKENYIRELTNDPEKLFKQIKDKFGDLPPDEIDITFTKARIQRTKWKSQVQ